MADPSPLRRARLRRSWTLDRVVEELVTRAPEGHLGVTPSMVSAWERGTTRTSPSYRHLLARLYDDDPEVLFAHQDAPGRVAHPRLLKSHGELLEAMLQVVHGARGRLVVTGSRSRDSVYLEAIEEALKAAPHLVHYRVLFGPPHRRVLQHHLKTMLGLRDPADRSAGVQTLHIGVVEDAVTYPERHFVASEQSAVVGLPSLSTARAFDSGVLVGQDEAVRLVEHAVQLYAASRPVETLAGVEELGVLREEGGGR